MASNVLASFTPGSMFVVRDKICVRTVANVMCQNTRNIGKGNFSWSSTALLNRIYDGEHELLKIKTAMRATSKLNISP